MTLSDLAVLSTAIGGIAVPLSLVYLAIQTTQAARQTRAMIQQGYTARSTQIGLSHQSSESCAAWIEGNGGEATAAAIRQLQFNLMCTTGVSAMEDLYLQRRGGFLTDEQFERNCEQFRWLLAGPGFRAYWTAVRDRIGAAAPKFRAFVDGLIVGEAATFDPLV